MNLAESKEFAHFAMHVEKEVARRIQVFLCDRELVQIAESFGGEVFRRSSALYGLAGFLGANNVRAVRCLEVGTWTGITAQILSRFCGEVVTIDVVDRSEKYEIDRFVCGLRGLDSSVKFVVSEPEKVSDAIMRERCGEGFDMAFLDGDHAKETLSNWDAVKHCGQVLFHECWPSQPVVWNLVKSLPRDEVTFGAFNFALWRKKK